MCLFVYLILQLIAKVRENSNFKHLSLNYNLVIKYLAKKTFNDVAKELTKSLFVRESKVS
jgi:hypothetical protein